MATGTISSLGFGSALELQNMLDQLKDIEKAPILVQEAEKETLQGQLNAFNNINAKLFSIKSNALSLSLESDFLKNQISVSDEELIDARVDDGVSESVNTIEVTQKARAHSLMSAGQASKSAVFHSEPSVAITNADAALTSGSENLSILYGALGDQAQISVDLESGLSLNQVAEAVNSSESNRDDDGNQLVTATVVKNSDDNYYLRLAASNGGNTSGSQIFASGLDYVKNDTTISVGKLDDTENMSWISIKPGTTIEEAAGLINAASDNPGVTAAVIDDGSTENPYKLVLTAKETGEENRIIVGNMSLTEVTGKDESLNAFFTVNGVDYQRQSNDAIDDVVAGATLTLKKAGEVTINIQNNTDSIKQSIVDLVDGFNALNEIVNGSQDGEDDGEETTTDSEPDSVLENSYTAKSIVSELREMFTTPISAGGNFTSLVDLGLSVNRDGSLSLDETELDQAIAADFDDVKKLFLGDEDAGVKGLGDIVNDGITDMVGFSGSVATEIDAFEEKMARLDENIASATERLDKKFDTMTAEFVRLDSYINQLNNQSTLLTSMIDSFNNTFKKN